MNYSIHPTCSTTPEIFIAGGPTGWPISLPVGPAYTTGWIEFLCEQKVERLCCLLLETELLEINEDCKSDPQVSSEKMITPASMREQPIPPASHTPLPTQKYALLDTYTQAFGAENICWSPTFPYLATIDQLRDEIFPFLTTSVANGKRTVIHDSTGRGRVGNIQAAWLVYAGGMTPEEAYRVVAAADRHPGGRADDNELADGREPTMALLNQVAKLKEM